MCGPVRVEKTEILQKQNRKNGAAYLLGGADKKAVFMCLFWFYNGY